MFPKTGSEWIFKIYSFWLLNFIYTIHFHLATMRLFFFFVIHTKELLMPVIYDAEAILLNMTTELIIGFSSELWLMDDDRFCTKDFVISRLDPIGMFLDSLCLWRVMGREETKVAAWFYVSGCNCIAQIHHVFIQTSEIKGSVRNKFLGTKNRIDRVDIIRYKKFV